ncbi:hypothetical protein AB6A40_004659 [Gnathostoma spinigerum]|uniref:Ribosomal RNA-processing protein 8 n=1 Tax=Gnathostoma spinigerum TaxID=75299 RepID=A0ABD6EE99_9BILA
MGISVKTETNKEKTSAPRKRNSTNDTSPIISVKLNDIAIKKQKLSDGSSVVCDVTAKSSSDKFYSETGRTNKELSVSPNSAKGFRKIKRPWRNKVRKLAMKAATRQKRLSTKAEENDVKKETLKKKKRKKKKQPNLTESGNSEVVVKKSEEASQLQSARFRFINEKLYTMTGSEAFKMFLDDPEAFEAYHEGFRSQLKKWPYNPLSGVIQWLRTQATDNPVIVDMGCGDAKIAAELQELATVHSFDLVAVNDFVTPCDMAHVPMDQESADIVVFCLSLMGTNVNDFLREAHRILKPKGMLKIVEVSSRIPSIKRFIFGLEKLGFSIAEKKFRGNGYFITLQFTKSGKIQQKRPLGLRLNPCIYKRR